MEAHVELTGGCCGHSDDGDWDDGCDCDSEDVHIEFTCPNAKEGEYKVVGQGKNGPKREWVKNKNACKQQRLKVGELSDQSLARWITEHYEPWKPSEVPE